MLPTNIPLFPTQLLRLGQLVIISIPTEMTTMAGRRLRKAVKDALVTEGVLDEATGVTVIAGLSNTYADYTTTFEEFQGQRYEAASTIYGPYQLAAYTQEYQKLAVAMAKGINPRSGLIPQDFSAHIHNVIPGEIHNPSAESPPSKKKFGDVEGANVLASYKTGDLVVVKFIGGWPNNDLRLQRTFLEVQMMQKSTTSDADSWVTVAVDGDPETRFRSKPHGGIGNEYRDNTVHWTIPAGTTPGQYRIMHMGTYYNDPLFSKGKMVEYNGTSAVFSVTA
jgi:neutral ceramidase